MRLIKGEEIYGELFDHAQNIEGPRDKQYICPARGWVTDFGAWLLPRLPKYEADRFDCDDYALTALTLADTAPTRLKHSPAIGVARVAIQEGKSLNGVEGGKAPHMTCVVRCDDNRWYYYEPQNNTMVELDKCRDVADLLFVWV